MTDILEPAQLEAVLTRFGFASPPPVDEAGLDDLYRAWCRLVPFDNTQKLLTLSSGAGGPLPVLAPHDFFAQWLRHGTGGTCWPSSNGLIALLLSSGFDARRVAGSMFEGGDLNHGAVVVTVHGDDFLVDSSMLTDRPVRITAEPTMDDDPVHPTAVEPVEGTFRFHFGVPFDPGGRSLRWRLMADPADPALFAERYEVSRVASIFNESRYARRNHADGVRALMKNTRAVKTATSFELQSDLDPDEQDRSLIQDIGLSEEIVARLRAAVPAASISGG